VFSSSLAMGGSLACQGSPANAAEAARSIFSSADVQSAKQSQNKFFRNCGGVWRSEKSPHFLWYRTVVTAAQFRPNKKASEAAVASPIEL